MVKCVLQNIIKWAHWHNRIKFEPPTGHFIARNQEEVSTIDIRCTVHDYTTLAPASTTVYQSSSVVVTFCNATIQARFFGSRTHNPLQISLTLRSCQNTATMAKATIKRIVWTPRASPALAPLEDPVGVLMLLVGAEVPLADDGDLVAADVDELELDLLADVWLVVDVPEVVVTVPLLVEEEVEEEVVEEAVVEEEEAEEEEVELDVVVVRVDDEGLADPTEFEPSTVILSL